MKLKQVIFVIQHSATTFALAYLLAISSNVNLRDALIMAGIVTLRDIKTLFDDIFDIGLTAEHRTALADVDAEIKKRNNK